MPRSLDSQRVRTLVRESIAAALTSEGETTRNILVDRFIERDTALFDRISKDFARRHVGTVVTKELSDWSPMAEGPQQMSLPGIPDYVSRNLPPLVIVPVPGEDPKHLLFTKAKVGDLRAYKKMLASHRESIGHTDDAVGFLVRRCVGVDDEVNLVDALKSKSDAAKQNPAA